MSIDMDTIVVANGDCPVREVGPGHQAACILDIEA